LKRMGKIRQPYYRVVVVDSRKKRDGRVIEEIGKYHPKEEPSFIDVVSERAQYWLGVGAQPSEAVEAILKITGDWQTFKGLPGTEGTLRTKEPKRDKTEIFNEALKDSAHESRGEAVTKKAAKKAAPAQEKPAAPAETAQADTAVAQTPAETPAATPEATPADESAVTTDAAAQSDVAQSDVAQSDVAQSDVAQSDVAQSDEAQSDEAGAGASTSEA
jgi:small subunit ribosomal protein S16